MNDKKLQELYSLIVSKDPSYANDVSLEQFKVNMQDEAYNTKMQNWLGTSAPPQNAGVDIDAFLGKKPVKKKRTRIRFVANSSGSGTYFGIFFRRCFFGFFKPK